MEARPRVMARGEGRDGFGFYPELRLGGGGDARKKAGEKRTWLQGAARSAARHLQQCR